MPMTISHKKFTKAQEVIDLLRLSGSEGCLVIEFSEFSNMDFDDVSFKNVVFNYCDFSNIQFNRCDIDHSRFNSCRFSFLEIKASKVPASIFFWCNIRNIDVSESRFTNVGMFCCSLYNCRILYSYFYRLGIQCSNISSISDAGSKASIFNDTDYISLGTCMMTCIDDHLMENFIYNTPVTCPEEGSFIGFKKVIISNPIDYMHFNGSTDYGIAKLLIPAEAKRTSGTGRKCRASLAEVLDITSLDGTKHFSSAISIFDNLFEYNVGDKVEPKRGYDDSREECGRGINFFLSRKEAVDYIP